MKRSTEKIIAVQVLTVIVAVTGLLLAQLLAGPRRAHAPASLLTGHGSAVSTASPWHSFKRLMHRTFGVGNNVREVTVPPEPPAVTPENSRDQ